MGKHLSLRGCVLLDTLKVPFQMLESSLKGIFADVSSWYSKAKLCIAVVAI